MSRHNMSSTTEPTRRIADQAEHEHSITSPLDRQQLERWAEAVACGDVPLRLDDVQANPALLEAIRTKRRTRLVRFLAMAIAGDILAEQRRHKESNP